MHLTLICPPAAEYFCQLFQICRRLKGLRFTNCKSGKDRTAMGATLEQIQLLQRRHELKQDDFQQAIDCMRRYVLHFVKQFCHSDRSAYLHQQYSLGLMV